MSSKINNLTSKTLKNFYNLPTTIDNLFKNDTLKGYLDFCFLNNERSKLSKALLPSTSYIKDKASTELEVYIRGPDNTSILTNLHTILLPLEDRGRLHNKKNLIKLTLLKEDVLPSIPPMEGLKEWKQEWKNFILSLNNHLLNIKSTKIGKLWQEDPIKVITKLSEHLKVVPEMDSYLQKLKDNLLEGYTNRWKKQDTTVIIEKFLIENPQIEKLKLNLHHYACNQLHEIVKSPIIKNKLEAIKLINPMILNNSFKDPIISNKISIHILENTNLPADALPWDNLKEKFPSAKIEILKGTFILNTNRFLHTAQHK